MPRPEWLEIARGEAPLLLSISHAGMLLPEPAAAGLRSEWLARRDADWWLEQLYGFVHRDYGATLVRTNVSRTVIDVNRDPSGASLYPGQATTGLCPETNFDGEPLYREGGVPGAVEIERRRAGFFDPYHAALAAELGRLRRLHPRVVLYDAHSIRSRIPRLFEGELPHLNLGTNHGRSCAPALEAALRGEMERSGLTHVVNGRFIGGWITRRYGDPERGVHGVQMEIACRAYMDEPAAPEPGNWPSPYRAERAAGLEATLRRVIERCLEFAAGQKTHGAEEAS